MLCPGICFPLTNLQPMNAGYTDGSVGFLSSTCSRDVLQALITANGNDVLGGNEF